MSDKAIEVCIEMLNDRGYNKKVVKDNYIKFTNTKTKETIGVILCQTVLNVKILEEYLSLMSKEKMQSFIIIYTENITSFTQKFINNVNTFDIELFSESELQYNITKHRLQPLFKRLPKDQSKEFIEKWGDKFPTMSLTDPIARYYNYKENDVIQIYRKTQDIVYRIVKKI